MIYEGWEPSLQASVRAFRLGMEGQAADALQRFVDSLTPFMPVLPPDLLQKVAKALPAVLEAQQRNDMIHVADLLEYEIRPLLVKVSGAALETDPNS